jgi:dTDP-glucose 4,6-dehydratase
MAAGAKRLLLTSSGSVYARRFARTPIAEDFAPAPDPLDMGDANAISGGAKRQAEALCAAYAREHGLGATVARCFAFLAPGLPLGGKFAAGNFVRDALALRPVVVRGDGSPIRSYLYGSDLAVWLWTLLLEGVAGQAYNVGSETGLSLRELAHQVVAEVAPGLPVEVLAERNLVQASDYYVPSTARARSELGLVERVSLAEAIRKTAEWQMAALKH